VTGLASDRLSGRTLLMELGKVRVAAYLYRVRRDGKYVYVQEE
jgi:hypothetical protein